MPRPVRRRPAEEEAKHGALWRADGHADADLSRALRDRAGDDAVEAEPACSSALAAKKPSTASTNRRCATEAATSS